VLDKTSLGHDTGREWTYCFVLVQSIAEVLSMQNQAHCMLHLMVAHKVKLSVGVLGSQDAAKVE
jgi:hypothetical protein